jgi:hypothetical protein
MLFNRGAIFHVPLSITLPPGGRPSYPSGQELGLNVCASIKLSVFQSQVEYLRHLHGFVRPKNEAAFRAVRADN